jgi:hypothetical protein
MNKRIIAKLTDADGKVWQKDGDFGMVAVADRQVGGGPLIEVDFTRCSAQDIAYLIATVMEVAGRADPGIPEWSISMYRKHTNGKEQV